MENIKKTRYINLIFIVIVSCYIIFIERDAVLNYFVLGAFVGAVLWDFMILSPMTKVIETSKIYSDAQEEFILDLMDELAKVRKLNAEINGTDQ